MVAVAGEMVEAWVVVELATKMVAVVVQVRTHTHRNSGSHT